MTIDIQTPALSGALNQTDFTTTGDVGSHTDKVGGSAGMTMNGNNILVSLVGYDDSIEVAPVDLHVMRTAIAVNKAGAILIKRYATKRRAPAAGMTNAADLDNKEFYRYIKKNLPLVVAFVANPRAGLLTLQHSGVDLIGVKYSIKLTLKRVNHPESN